MDVFDAIQVGRDGAVIRNIVHGTISALNPNFTGSATVGQLAVASASAAAGGLRTGMKIFTSTRVESTAVPILGAECLADDVMTIWFGNPHTAAQDPGSAVTFDYLAIR